MRTRLKGSIAAAALIVAAMPGAAPALAADPVSVVFDPTDAEQQWTVPDDVTAIHIVLIGAKGSGGGGFPGGLGHNVSGDLGVTPGTVLYVNVGGKGSGTTPGFNGGGHAGVAPVGTAGAGGGASDIRTISRTTPGTLDSRLMVAGGGGGVGHGTRGGNAGAAGGGNPDTIGGRPGTATGGGTGGLGDVPGVAGVLAVGGDGASWCGFDICAAGTAGGGGGGGYYGGGGGAGFSAEIGLQDSGGGGGGSAYTGNAANASVAVETELDASITITYTPGGDPPDPPEESDTGVVDAEVTVPTSAACVELSATSVGFGTQRFGAVDVQADPGITVTNCSGAEAELFARGTDASGTGAAWQLVDNAASCGAGTLATDDFHLKIRRPANEADPVTQLSTNNKEIAELGAGDDADLEALLDMPCPGSSGAGQTMGMQIVFVVTELE